MDFTVKNKTILGVAAHADDLDFSSSGTLSKWINEGAEVYYLILTDGSKGYEDHMFSSEKLATIRQEEQKNAAKILGVKYVYFENFIDGELANERDVKKAIVKKIRELKPDVVITLDPTFFYDEATGFINHPDHRAAGQATLDSVFPFARNSRTYPELMEENFPPHSVKDIFLVNFKSANYFVDISETLPKKLEAIKAHKSQYKNFSDVKNEVTKRTQGIGKKAGYKYAEGFIRITIPN